MVTANLGEIMRRAVLPKFLRGIEMKRIQRKRTRGWRMPENTVYVGRPTKYGNPYSIGLWPIQEVLNAYEKWLRDRIAYNPHFLDELKGKDLACWCPLDKPCHADIILKILETER
jgi:hypothetical protein